MIPRTFVLSLLVALAFAIHSKPATAQTNITAAEARKIAQEAYIYGYPMVDGYRIQAQHRDLAQALTEHGE